MNLDNYEPVAVRLDRWLKGAAEAGHQPRVVTHLEHYQGDHVVVRAELYLGDILVATGLAEEVRGSSHITKGSHVEVCETSAVGRALANAGLAGSDLSKRPTREEMTKAQGYAFPQGYAFQGGAQRPQAGPGEASPAQRGKIRALSKSLGKLPPANLDGLSKRDASDLIEKLIAESQAAPAQEDPF
jgi:hypothetical protein